MVEGHGLSQHHVVCFRQADSLFQLIGVQGDGFLAQDVLARRQRLAQILDVGVVRGGDINDVHVFIGKNVINLVIDLLNAVFLCESDSLGVGAVGNGIQLLPTAGQRLRQLIGNHAAAEGSPTVGLHR